MKVFLGGTVDGYDWRESFMKSLDELHIEYFNPVVEDYDDNARLREEKEKEDCDMLLFVITNDIAGVYSIAEVTEKAVEEGNRVIFCNLFTRNQSDADIRLAGSLSHTEKLLSRYTMNICHTLQEALQQIRLLQKCLCKK